MAPTALGRDARSRPARAPSPAARALALGAALALLAALASAQEHEPDASRTGQRSGQQEPAVEPLRAFEFALSADGIGVGYRTSFRRGNGYEAVRLFISDDQDVVLDARLMRFGEPSTETPLAFGVGLGAFGAYVDESDAKILAFPLTGSIEYQLGLTYPVRIGVEASYAPDLSSFVDGERVVELVGRAEADLSTWATAFAGYRHLE